MKWYVLRTPWHSLIVHIVNDDLVPGYEIVAGPFQDSEIAPKQVKSGLLQAEEAKMKLLNVNDQEMIDMNARVSEPHMAYPNYDMSKGNPDAP